MLLVNDPTTPMGPSKGTKQAMTVLSEVVSSI